MRMVIEVSDELHAKVKTRARAEGRPMSKVVRQLLENYVIDGWSEAKEYHDTLVMHRPPTKAKPITKQDQAKGRTRK